MSVRVNLLRPDERHLYSAVGRSFMIKLAGGAAGFLLVLFSVLALYNLRTVVGGLGSAREHWSEVEGAYERALVVKGELDQHLALDRELSGWSAGRVDWRGPLQELQDMVPTNVQLTALNVSSSIKVIKGDRKPGAKAGAKEPPPDRMARVFTVRLDGKAFGTMADQVVTRFVDELRRAPTITPWLESLGLQGLQRANRDESTDGEWIFRIEAESSERILE